MTRHPVQPLYTDKHGTVRCKNNMIVCYLLGLSNENELARMKFSRDDKEQLAQLTGASLASLKDMPDDISSETIDLLECRQTYIVGIQRFWIMGAGLSGFLGGLAVAAMLSVI